MSQHSPADSTSTPEQTTQRLRVEDLERRIEELEAIDSASLGAFTTWDWVVCVVVGLIIPILALWWFVE